MIPKVLSGSTGAHYNAQRREEVVRIDKFVQGQRPDQSLTVLKGESPYQDSSINTSKKWAALNDGRAQLNILNRNGRQVYLISAFHFSQQAADILVHDIAPKIVNPDTWVLLIEGKGHDAIEVRAAHHIAEQYNVPIEDPILNHMNHGVIDVYYEQFKDPCIPKNIFLGYVLAAKAGSTGIRDFELLAAEYGMSLAEVFRYMQNFSQFAQTNSNYPELIKAIEEQLLVVSNQLSAQYVDYLLNKYKDATNVVVYLGEAHAPIFTGSFSPIISESRMKQIVDDLAAREKAVCDYQIKKYLQSLEINIFKTETQNPSSPAQKIERESIHDEPKKALEVTIISDGDPRNFVRDIQRLFDRFSLGNHGSIKTGYYVNNNSVIWISLAKFWQQNSTLMQDLTRIITQSPHRIDRWEMQSQSIQKSEHSSSERKITIICHNEAELKKVCDSIIAIFNELKVKTYLSVFDLNIYVSMDSTDDRSLRTSVDDAWKRLQELQALTPSLQQSSNPSY